MINIRNPKHMNESGTMVDVEIEHPEYGWIPYTFISDQPDESYDEEIRAYLTTATIEPFQPNIENIEREKKFLIDSTIQNMLDTEAQNNRFDNIKSARSQATAQIPAVSDQRLQDAMANIVNKAKALADWELKVWATAIIIEEDVAAGTRAEPTLDEIMLELPALVLP